MKLRITKSNLLGILLFPFTALAAPITGEYVGTFINPVPTSPPSVTTGIGTDSITWGVPCDGVTNCFTSPGGITPPSAFSFTSIPFVTELDTPFTLGELEFFNGTIMPGTEISAITLFLDGFQITPTQFAGPDSREISIVNTPNSADPIASADRATIPLAIFPAADTFGVLESQTSIATLLGIFTEVSPELMELEILGYGEATDDNSFLENFAPPTNVPEPTTIFLLILGLSAIFHTRLKSL